RHARELPGRETVLRLGRHAEGVAVLRGLIQVVVDVHRRPAGRGRVGAEADRFGVGAADRIADAGQRAAGAVVELHGGRVDLRAVDVLVGLPAAGTRVHEVEARGVRGAQRVVHRQ